MPPGRLSGPVRRKFRWILGVTALAVAALATTGAMAPAASAGAANPAPLTQSAWHNDIVHLATPAKGCFTATYPVLSWKTVGCTAAPHKPFPPRTAGQGSGPATVPGAVASGTGTGPTADTVGNGVDFSAGVTGVMTGATGSFPTVSGVTSESDGGVANSYSLQLNSKPFVSPVCAGYAGCYGWEQFVYSNPGTAPGSAFIQFWILNYFTTCPSGWWSYASDCYTNGPAVTIASQPITNLANLSLTGTVSGGAGGTDTTSFTAGGTTVSSVTTDSTLGLSADWAAVEFMIGGDGGGSSADFNPGSTIVVQTVTHNGTTNAPTCLSEGYTGETNNLTLVGSPAYLPGSSPSIRSTQSNVAGTVASCAAASGDGDIHVVTVNGTMYDQQVSGEFTALQNANMTVQNEEVNGAPTWPLASVNSAVATKMGSDTVAVCRAGGRLIVDGSTTSLADGQTITLGSGDTVHRAGNIYIVTDPQGDSMKATIYSTNIDLSVGLGSYPEAASGLFANAPGSTTQLETSTGAVVPTPLTLSSEEAFAESWRVPASATPLTAVCGDQVVNSDPKSTFWADELPQAVQAQALAVCKSAGVQNTALLEACTLDVAVLGNGAAASYIGEPAPTDVAFSEDTPGSGAPTPFGLHRLK